MKKLSVMSKMEMCMCCSMRMCCAALFPVSSS